MLRKLAALTAGLLLAGLVLVPAGPPALASPTTLFTIGAFELGDNAPAGSDEFSQTGWRYTETYECYVNPGIGQNDCEYAAGFPAGIHMSSYSGSNDVAGVITLIMHFSLGRAYDDVALQVARYGAEDDTIVVTGPGGFYWADTFDGTAESRRDDKTFSLGDLAAGDYTITITTANDGADGFHWWDAFELTGEAVAYTFTWLPPLSRDGFTVLTGSSVPIKFALADPEGNLYMTPMDASVYVYDEDGLVDTLTPNFDLGVYNAVWHTGDYAAGTYTAEAEVDGTVLSSIGFELVPPPKAGQGYGPGQGLGPQPEPGGPARNGPNRP